MDMRHSNIFEEMIKLTPLCSGTLREQYFPCGKKNCRCQDKETPKLHGPYYVWARLVGGRRVSRTLRPGSEVEKVKDGIQNYRRFQDLIWELLRQEEDQVLSPERSANEVSKKNFRKRSRKR